MSVAARAAADILAACSPDILGQALRVNSVSVDGVFVHLDDATAPIQSGVRSLRGRLTCSLAGLGFLPVAGQELEIDQHTWLVTGVTTREDILRVTVERYAS